MPTLDAVRGRREELEKTLAQLERAIAAPAPGRASGWIQGVRIQLSALGEGFAQHIQVTEGPDGLHEDVLRRAPRLVPMITHLQKDHAAIRDAIQRLLTSLSPDADTERVAKVREEVLAVLGRLARHRQRGADLIYEAYSVDIGSGE